MRVRKLCVSITAMAVMGAFGSAFAQTSTQQSGSSKQSSSTDVQVSPNTTIDARGRSSVNVGEVSGSASTTQDSSINQRSQSSTSSQSGSASAGARGSASAGASVDCEPHNKGKGWAKGHCKDDPSFPGRGANNREQSSSSGSTSGMGSSQGSASSGSTTQQSGSSQQSSSTDVQVSPSTTIDARGRSSVNVGGVSGSSSTTQDSSIKQGSQSK